jgi:hypothetical protein
MSVHQWQQYQQQQYQQMATQLQLMVMVNTVLAVMLLPSRGCWLQRLLLQLQCQALLRLIHSQALPLLLVR